MDLAQWIVFGLAAAAVGVILIAVPMRARIMELRDERDAWRTRAHMAEGLVGQADIDDVKVIPQAPREHGLEVFYGDRQEGSNE